MDFIKKLASYWFFLVVMGLVIYFCISNIEFIYVRVPHIGEFKTRAAFAFLSAFMAGSAVGGAWFGMDTLKKALKVRSLSRRVQQLQNELQELQAHQSTTSTKKVEIADQVETTENAL
jgi:uncharacterized membrane protein YciS (DUF1049 family)